MCLGTTASNNWLPSLGLSFFIGKMRLDCVSFMCRNMILNILSCLMLAPFVQMLCGHSLTYPLGALEQPCLDIQSEGEFIIRSDPRAPESSLTSLFWVQMVQALTSVTPLSPSLSLRSQPPQTSALLGETRTRPCFPEPSFRQGHTGTGTGLSPN